MNPYIYYRGFFMNELNKRVLEYFNMSDEDKDDVLVEIVNIYKEKISQHKGLGLLEVIEHDIEYFKENEEFEIVQALTDIKQAIIQITNELYG